MNLQTFKNNQLVIAEEKRKKDKQRAASKAWQAANQDRIKAYAKKWYKEKTKPRRKGAGMCEESYTLSIHGNLTGL